MPQSASAEWAAVGLCLQQPDLLDVEELFDESADLVVSSRCRLALKTLRDYREGGTSADLVSCEEPFTRAGLTPWAAVALQAEEAAAPTVWYAVRRTLRETAYRRRLWRVADHLRTAATSEDTAVVRDVVSYAIERLTQVEPGVASVPIELREGALAHLPSVLQRADGKQQGWAVGMPQVDAMLRGLRPGEMTVLAARPSVGKSALAHQIALDVAMQGGRVLLCTPEMSRTQVFDRFLSMVGDVSASLVQSGKLSPVALGVIRGRMNAVPDGVRVWDESHMTTAMIAGRARQERGAKGLDLLIVDHLGWVADVAERGESRATLIGRMTKRLKGLGQALGCHVLLVSQLNRTSEDGDTMQVPGLSSLRESGEIEQDADTVLLLHRETREAMQGAVYVAKNRQGPTGMVPMLWSGTTTTWKERTL